MTLRLFDNKVVADKVGIAKLVNNLYLGNEGGSRVGGQIFIWVC